MIGKAGVSTRENGKGFGLHYSANAVTGMDRRIDLTSDGPKGVRYVCFFLPFLSLISYWLVMMRFPD